MKNIIIILMGLTIALLVWNLVTVKDCQTTINLSKQKDKEVIGSPVDATLSPNTFINEDFLRTI